MNNQQVEKWVEFLNELLKLDKHCMKDLLDARVPCNNSMAEHYYVVVGTYGGIDRMGFLGLLNGYLSWVSDTCSSAPIIVCINDDTEEVEKFSVNPRWADLASFDKYAPKLYSIEPLLGADKDELQK